MTSPSSVKIPLYLNTIDQTCGRLKEQAIPSEASRQGATNPERTSKACGVSQLLNQAAPVVIPTSSCSTSAPKTRRTYRCAQCLGVPNVRKIWTVCRSWPAIREGISMSRVGSYRSTSGSKRWPMAMLLSWLCKESAWESRQMALKQSQ